MNILKYTNRFIKSGFVGITCLACFPHAITWMSFRQHNRIWKIR